MTKYVCMFEKLSKKKAFGVDFKLKVPPFTYKINTDNISGVKNWLKGYNGQLCTIISSVLWLDAIANTILLVRKWINIERNFSSLICYWKALKLNRFYIKLEQMTKNGFVTTNIWTSRKKSKYCSVFGVIRRMSSIMSY